MTNLHLLYRHHPQRGTNNLYTTGQTERVKNKIACNTTRKQRKSCPSQVQTLHALVE
uniref:Glycine cleavage system H protein 1 n=1 Tax=Arundo donax TaxID=35708 RepID=A0A0A9DP99_ARUDO